MRASRSCAEYLYNDRFYLRNLPDHTRCTRTLLIATAALMMLAGPALGTERATVASVAPAAAAALSDTASSPVSGSKPAPKAIEKDPKIKARSAGYVPVRRGRRAPRDVNHVLVVDGKGAPIRSRRAIFVREYTVKPGDTIRTVAYRYSTSPLAIARANDIDWDGRGTPLPAGEKLSVPVRYRAASGFARAVRLRTGAGVRAERSSTTWGRPYVIALLTDAFRAMHRLWPDRHPGIVGSLSRLGGGKLRPHKSHRAGRDIDIGYFTVESERKHWGVPRLHQIDYARLWFFVDRLERSGQLAAVYMSPGIQYRLHSYARARGARPERLKTMFQFPCARGARTTLIRHSRGHRDHMHIRFGSPADVDELSS